MFTSVHLPCPEGRSLNLMIKQKSVLKNIEKRSNYEYKTAKNCIMAEKWNFGHNSYIFQYFQNGFLLDHQGPKALLVMHDYTLENLSFDPYVTLPKLVMLYSKCNRFIKYHISNSNFVAF